MDVDVVVVDLDMYVCHDTVWILVGCAGAIYSLYGRETAECLLSAFFFFFFYLKRLELFTHPFFFSLEFSLCFIPYFTHSTLDRRRVSI